MSQVSIIPFHLYHKQKKKINKGYVIRYRQIELKITRLPARTMLYTSSGNITNIQNIINSQLKIQHNPLLTYQTSILKYITHTDTDTHTHIHQSNYLGNSEQNIHTYIQIVTA